MEKDDKNRVEDASWDETGDDPNVWDKVRKGVVDGYHYAAEKTDMYSKIGNRRLHIVGINRKVDRAYSEMGERVYSLISGGRGVEILEDASIKELVERIRLADEELAHKEAEIEAIRVEAAQKRTSEE